jgi:small subunit ribosomal protein S5
MEENPQENIDEEMKQAGSDDTAAAESAAPESHEAAAESVPAPESDAPPVTSEADAEQVATELGAAPESEAAPAADSAITTAAAAQPGQPGRAQPRKPSAASIAAVASSSTESQDPSQRRRSRGGREGGGRPRSGDGAAQQRGGDTEWDEKIIQVRRVTKVVKGGKKLSFRAVVAVGNNSGNVGIGVGKAAEVMGAIQKGIVDAKKSLVKVPLIGATIPHEIIGKQGSSKITLKPAAKGTGIIAGGAARSILELAGVGDVLSKSLGSRSPLNVARATIDGLSRLRTFEKAAALRGITLRQMFS